MNLKNIVSSLLKVSAAGAAGVVLSTFAGESISAQQVGSRIGPRNVQQRQVQQRHAPQQRVMNTAPKLLHAQSGEVPIERPTAQRLQRTAQRQVVNGRTSVPGRSPQASPARSFVPRHLQSSGVNQVSYKSSRFANNAVSNGEIIGGESIISGGGCEGGCGVGYDGGGYGDCGCGDMGCGGCADTGCGYGEDPCGYARYPSLISFSDMEFFGGGLAFKGPLNLGQGGSFGFYEGINWGFPMPLFQGLGLSGQLGFSATQTNANGAGFTAATREQYFATGGVFRRVDYGLQFGVAYDYMQENWYFDGAFGQIRGDISWVGSYGNTIGFQFSNDFENPTGLGAQSTALVPAAGPFNTFVPVDTYRLYLQRPLYQSGGLVDLSGGFSGSGQGILGGTISVPLTERFMIRSSGTILIDNGSTAAARNIDENWNVSIGLVFMPKGWTAWKRAYHRPMFDVGNNSNFLLGRQ